MSLNYPTILVVDPDEKSYKTIQSALGNQHQVLFVPNGKTAIGLPDKQKIDIIFVSHVLNGTDGIMLLESFKKRFPSIPVVLIAEQPKVDEVITAFRSGARELIIKPLDEKELAAVTKKIFGLVSNKKAKWQWFSAGNKEANPSPMNNWRQDSTGHFKKIFHKFKKPKRPSAIEFDEFQVKETISLKEDSNNKLVVDALIDPEQLDKETHPVKQIKKSDPQIEAFFLGSFRVFVNNQAIENWPGKKGKSIFAYLLLNYKKKIFRDVLMDIFWQKSCPDSARNCLNVTIHGLRRVLEEIDHRSEYILFKDECYYFNPEIEIRLDVEGFRKTWRRAQSIEHDKGLSAAVSEYERAAEIYNGEFLEEEIYDNWPSLDRENLKEIYLVILDKISENYMLNNDYSETIRLCKKILEKDNCREDIYRRLMECYYRFGQRDRAIKLFRKCSRVLMNELEVKPTTNTIELYRIIKESQL